MGRSMSSTATQVMWKLDDIVRNRQEMAEKEFARAERNQYQTNKIANRKIDSAEKIQEMMNSGALDIQELKNSGILSKTEMEQAGLTERAIIKDRGDSSRTQMKEGGMAYRQQAGFENDRTKPVWRDKTVTTTDEFDQDTTTTTAYNVNTAENRNDGQDGGSLGANDDVKSMLQSQPANADPANYGDPRLSQKGTGYIQVGDQRTDIIGNTEQPARTILPRGTTSQPAVPGSLDARIERGLTDPNQYQGSSLPVIGQTASNNSQPVLPPFTAPTTNTQPVVTSGASNSNQTPVPLASSGIAARPAIDAFANKAQFNTVGSLVKGVGRAMTYMMNHTPRKKRERANTRLRANFDRQRH